MRKSVTGSSFARVFVFFISSFARQQQQTPALAPAVADTVLAVVALRVKKPALLI
jgi:hypothetical protein